MPTVDGSSARAREADEGRLGGLNHRATPGVGKAYPVFLRKKCPRSSSYHISHLLLPSLACLSSGMSAQPFSAWNAAWRDSYATMLLVVPKRDGGWESTQQDGGKPVWRSARQTGVRHGSRTCASLIFPIHHTRGRWMPSFVLSRKAGSRPSVQAMTCSLSIPSGLSHRFFEALLEDRLW